MQRVVDEVPLNTIDDGGNNCTLPHEPVVMHDFPKSDLKTRENKISQAWREVYIY